MKMKSKKERRKDENHHVTTGIDNKARKTVSSTDSNRKKSEWWGENWMLDQCSTPSSHYWTGNIDWFEQALPLHVKDCVYKQIHGNTSTNST